ncbi:hypothetical protein [Rubellimicrobium arenae]|uniref:hypothetical protein n=1 Tax=Rubellimicrobium arenae TaxID=2817372 RepID=UPI001B3071B1|nr:hypothetical protein [Rubellimicrobium arenae]
MTRPLLLHVGYHKTATTWMQNALFTPVHGYRQVLSHKEVFDGLLRPHGLQFAPDAMRDLIAERRAQVPDNETPVISSELISGNPFFGGRESDDYARRLRDVAPDARILVSIREQTRILPSVYMQYIRRGGTMPIARFFDGESELGYFGFAPEHFEYDRLVGLYQDLFGAENVFVLPQEGLRKAMDDTAASLAEFAGNTGFQGLSPEARKVRGASDPEYAVPVLRRVNHIRTSALDRTPAISLGPASDSVFKGTSYLLRRPFVNSMFKARTPVSDYVRSRFAGHYAASNARLRDLVRHPVDLTSYK